MESPSAAVYFSHLKFSLLRCFSYSFVFRNVHHRAKDRRKAHTDVVVVLACGSKQTMCRLWGYQCVPFIVLRRRDFYTNFSEAMFIARAEMSLHRKENSSSSGKGDAGGRADEILSISCRTCITFIARGTRLTAIPHAAPRFKLFRNFSRPDFFVFFLTIIGFRACCGVLIV